MYEHGRYYGGAEVDKCRDRLAVYCKGDGLDIGCGGTAPDQRFYNENKIIPTAIGVDLARTNLTGRADRLIWFRSESMDYIFSSHLLEHLDHPQIALVEWFRVLKPGGYLVMYLPLENVYPNVGEPGANKDHKHNLNPGKILCWLNSCGINYKIIRIAEQTDKDEYSFDFVIRKIN